MASNEFLWNLACRKLQHIDQRYFKQIMAGSHPYGIPTILIGPVEDPERCPEIIRRTADETM